MNLLKEFSINFLNKTVRQLFLKSVSVNLSQIDSYVTQ